MRADGNSVTTLNHMEGILEEVELNWKPEKWVFKSRHWFHIMEEGRAYQATKLSEQMQKV